MPDFFSAHAGLDGYRAVTRSEEHELLSPLSDTAHMEAGPGLLTFSEWISIDQDDLQIFLLA